MSRLNLGLHLFNGVRYWPYSLLHINTLSQSRRSSLLTEHENKIMKSVSPNTPYLTLPHLKVSGGPWDSQQSSVIRQLYPKDRRHIPNYKRSLASSGEFLESARAAVESLADAGAAGELLIDAGTASVTLMTQCRGFFKFFNITERLNGGEFYLSACRRSIPTHSGGNDFVMEEPPDSQLMV